MPVAMTVAPWKANEKKHSLWCFLRAHLPCLFSFAEAIDFVLIGLESATLCFLGNILYSQYEDDEDSNTIVALSSLFENSRHFRLVLYSLLFCHYSIFIDNGYLSILLMNI
jgi:hypothetical protein